MKPTPRTAILRIVLPLLIAAVGVAGVVALVTTRPNVAPNPPEVVAPLVRVIEAQPSDLQLRVRALGTVVPRTESELVAQVAGEVEWVAPELVSGGFFAADDPLVRIDRTDYRIEVESARAALARARSEAARARKELARQERLAEERVASEARIDDARNAAAGAEAALREARARLERAQRDLERTELKAPYQGRVRSERVDVGQFVNRGESMATLYAVDYAEVRLPVPDRDLRYLGMDLLGGGVTGETGPEVLLRAEFAGLEREWKGRIVRTEGEIDPKSRMVNLVARVEAPYARREGKSAPLAVGLFVEAEILGSRVDDVFVLPREALRPEQPDFPEHVHLVDADDRLVLRPVEVLRTDRSQVIVEAGLARGDRVSVSPLTLAVDGMAVRIAETLPANLASGSLPSAENAP